MIRICFPRTCRISSFTCVYRHDFHIILPVDNKSSQSELLNTSSQGKLSLQALTITIFSKEQLTYSLLNYLKILLYCADKTETKVAAAEVGVVAAPAVHPAVVGIVVPAAAATTAVAAVVRADTPAPLPNVTAHII